MFKVNDYIIYGTTGVCKIIEIKKEKFLGREEKEYYVLEPVYSKNTVIKIPVDNTTIKMREVLSKDYIEELINIIPNTETEWIDDDKLRSEHFKTVLKSGNCEELITLIRTIYLSKKDKKSIGKKLYKVDDEIMQAAEKLLNEEFAFVLDIDPKEVPQYIANHIKE
ncbi:CarD-like/TRCF domain [uncultured Clostridium sp.]|uniref:CarD family transcriptional regulator n=1 Tax=uncultured Clostridium sp. TaxID=59620 RepID=UPI0008222083|nr:CarD family transcriptional regulator [uncultured Clostridium sp.]SCK02348.1 CarD-like/TRCF domain [uncultured Clostridium sp.]